MILDENMVIPERTALILGGNGRWAEKHGLPRTMGHKKGYVTAEKTVEIAAKMSTRYLTVYGFSTENWKRSKEEVGALMQLFRYYMIRLLEIATANSVRVKMIEDRTRFDPDIIEGINRLGSQTKGNTGLIFVIAMNYGGRDEIRRAAARLAQDCMAGKMDTSRTDETVIASYLDTVDMLDPDLLIRTSGELRLFSYLPWQLTYTEIVVTGCLWPGFNQEELGKAIVQYSRRDRWFRAVKQCIARKKKAVLMTRLISGITLVLLSIMIVGQGGAPLFGVTVLISVISLFELYRVLGIEKRSLAVIGYATACSYCGILWFEDQRYMTLLIIVSLMVMTTLYVFTFPKYKTEEITGAFSGVCYVPMVLSFLYQTRVMSGGAYLVWLILISSWGCDTCAYCSSMFLERHKPTPVLNPKKSIEGAVGGVLGATLLGLVYTTFFDTRMSEFQSPQASCAIAYAIATVISQIGDLAASAIRRNHGIKDYGKLTPDHGGILDRFDSMIFTAPAIYFALTFLR